MRRPAHRFASVGIALAMAVACSGCDRDEGTGLVDASVPLDESSQVDQADPWTPPDWINPYDFAHQCGPPTARFDGGACDRARFNGHTPDGTFDVGNLCDDISVITTRADLVCALRQLSPRFDCRPCAGNCPQDRWRCSLVFSGNVTVEDMELLCAASTVLVDLEQIYCSVLI